MAGRNQHFTLCSILMILSILFRLIYEINYGYSVFYRPYLLLFSLTQVPAILLLIFFWKSQKTPGVLLLFPISMGLEFLSVYFKTMWQVLAVHNAMQIRSLWGDILYWKPSLSLLAFFTSCFRVFLFAWLLFYWATKEKYFKLSCVFLLIAICLSAVCLVFDVSKHVLAHQEDWMRIILPYVASALYETAILLFIILRVRIAKAAVNAPLPNPFAMSNSSKKI